MATSPSPVTALPRLVFFSRSLTQPALIESLHLALKTSTEYQYRTTELVDQMKEIVSRSTRVVILANCLTKEDITDLYNVLPTFAERISDGTVRVVVLNSIRHPKLPELLRTRGTVEVVDLPTTQKNLQYKLKNSLISVHQSYLKKDQAKDAATPIEVGTENIKTSLRSPERNADTDVLWQASIGFDFDFWWIASAKHLRRVVGVWLIDLIGPGPSAGTWEEVPGFDRGGEKAWMWRTRWLADEAFQTTDGHWFFFGKQPEFSWQKGMWTFVSKTPALAFFPNGTRTPKYTRFEYKPEEGLIFFENSHVTQLLLPRIQATLETRVGTQNGDSSPEIVELPDQFEEFELPPEVVALEEKARLSPAPIEIPQNSVLVAKSENAASIGLGTIEIAGVSAGAGAYEKTDFGVDVIRKNGKLGTADLQPPKIYEVTRSGATVMLEPALAKIGDRFHFRFHFSSGDKRAECLMEWELQQIEMAFENQLLASGGFISGDFGPLDHVLESVEERRKELREFYDAARG